MNATGNFKPGDITSAKLLGQPEPKPRRERQAKVIDQKMPVNELFELLQAENKERSNGATK